MSIKILLYTSMVILTIGIFNWIIDPFDIFNSSVKTGLHLNKPEITTHIRPYKAIKLQTIKPKTVFMGTSRTEVGLDPTNKNFDPNTTWNSAVSSGLPVEYEYYMDTATKNGAKHIIIGIDLFAFYAKDLVRSGFEKDAFSDFKPLKYIFSMDVLQSSVKTIGSSKPSPYLRTGRRNPIISQQECDENGGHKKLFQISGKGYFIGSYTNEFSKTQVAHWQSFERILDKAHKNGVKVTLFISPSHARQWEILALTQGYEIFEAYKRELVIINEKVAQKNGKLPFNLWDFSGYHELTTESVPDDPRDRMKWYWDSSHYKKELGDIVLDRMFDGNFSGGQNYPDFGAKLTSRNIEVHLRKLRADRVKWQSTHTKDMVEIQSLKDL